MKISLKYIQRNISALRVQLAQSTKGELCFQLFETDQHLIFTSSTKKAGIEL